MTVSLDVKWGRNKPGAVLPGGLGKRAGRFTGLFLPRCLARMKSRLGGFHLGEEGLDQITHLARLMGERARR